MKRISFLFDVLVVVIFVAIGRSAHHHGISFDGMLSTFWPFATGLCIGWLFALSRHRDVQSWSCGVVISLVTVAMGMILRVVSGQGTAFAFILVALAFLGLVMLGWRIAFRLFSRRRIHARATINQPVDY
jgi:hypothetical protein